MFVKIHLPKDSIKRCEELRYGLELYPSKKINDLFVTLSFKYINISLTKIKAQRETNGDKLASAL